MKPEDITPEMWAAWNALPEKEREYWLEVARFNKEIRRMEAAQADRKRRLKSKVRP